jgi:hypothetical protein
MSWFWGLKGNVKYEISWLTISFFNGENYLNMF